MEQKTISAVIERLSRLKNESIRLRGLLSATKDPAKKQRLERNLAGVRRQINILLPLCPNREGEK